MNQLPYPIDYYIETAAVYDLKIAKQTFLYLDMENIDLYADKGYIEENFQLDLFENKRVNLIAPNNKKKNKSI